jgi:hypothetical protein
MKRYHAQNSNPRIADWWSECWNKHSYMTKARRLFNIKLKKAARAFLKRQTAKELREVE